MLFFPRLGNKDTEARKVSIASPRSATPGGELGLELRTVALARVTPSVPSQSRLHTVECGGPWESDKHPQNSGEGVAAETLKCAGNNELSCRNGLALADPHFILMKTLSHNLGGAPVGESGSDPAVPASQTSPQVCKPCPFGDMCLRKQCRAPSFRILKGSPKRSAPGLSTLNPSGR